MSRYQEADNLSNIYRPLLPLGTSLVVSSPCPVTSRNQSYSLVIVLDKDVNNTRICNLFSA